MALQRAPPPLPAQACRHAGPQPTPGMMSEPCKAWASHGPWRPEVHGKRQQVCCHSSSGGRGGGSGGGPQLEGLQNLELLIGDCLCLLCFALYKQARAAGTGFLLPVNLSPMPAIPAASRLSDLLVNACMLLGSAIRCAPACQPPTYPNMAAAPPAMPGVSAPGPAPPPPPFAKADYRHHFPAQFPWLAGAPGLQPHALPRVLLLCRHPAGHLGRHGCGPLPRCTLSARPGLAAAATALAAAWLGCRLACAPLQVACCQLLPCCAAPKGVCPGLSDSCATLHAAPPSLQACSPGGTDLPPPQTCRQRSGARGACRVQPAAWACIHPVSLLCLVGGSAASPLVHASPAGVLNPCPAPDPCCLPSLRPRPPAAAPAACGSSACPWRRPSWCC